MQDPNAPYQSVGQPTAMPVNPSPYQQPMQPPYQGQPGMYQQPMMVPQQTYQPPMGQPVVVQPVASPVYGQPLSQPVVMPPQYGDGAYERNQEMQRKKLWIGIVAIVALFVVVDIVNFIFTGRIIIWY